MGLPSTPRFHSGINGLEGRLWGIAGHFSQPEAPDGIAFGGYFFQDTHLGATILSGKLVDGLGESIILEGELIPGIRLAFIKRYCRSNSALLRYEFEESDGAYVGKYWIDNCVGRAQCSIQSL